MGVSVPLAQREASFDRNLMLALGRSLASVRDLYQLSREEVAAQSAEVGIGTVNRNKIEKWERGQTVMSVADLFALSAVLGPFWTWPVPMDDVDMTESFRRVQDIFA